MAQLFLHHDGPLQRLHYHASPGRLSIFCPILLSVVNKTPRYLNLLWSSNSHPPGTSNCFVFRAENHGLRFQSADPHSSCEVDNFTDPNPHISLPSFRCQNDDKFCFQFEISTSSTLYHSHVTVCCLHRHPLTMQA